MICGSHTFHKHSTNCQVATCNSASPKPPLSHISVSMAFLPLGREFCGNLGLLFGVLIKSQDEGSRLPARRLPSVSPQSSRISLRDRMPPGRNVERKNYLWGYQFSGKRGPQDPKQGACHQWHCSRCGALGCSCGGWQRTVGGSVAQWSGRWFVARAGILPGR